MMCEECGIRPAKFHLMTITNDEKTERNLCPVCMAKYQKQLPGIDFSNLAGILNSILDGSTGKQKEPEDASIGELACEQCGMTYAEFQKCGMLGCADCYKTFKAPLDSLLQRIHGNTQHAGRIPGSVRSGVSIRLNIDRLKQRLQKAIAEEEYEQAAKLRDSIRALNAQLAEQEKQTDIKVEPPKRITAEAAEGGELDG